MQSRNLLLILSIGALAAFGGCERHDWEDTRKLHQAHGGGDHGDDHKTEGDDHHAKEGKEAHSKPKTEEKGSDEEKPKGQPRTL